MKLILLDRDGVINYDSLDYIKSPDEWIPLPGSLQAIAQLNHAGYTVAVATNQSGIARGYYDEKTLGMIHQKMSALLAEVGGHIDKIVYCPHLPSANCQCRKPQPGMLLQIAAFYNCSINGIPYIGDKWSDVLTARAVNAKPILVKSNLNVLTDDITQQMMHDVDQYKDLAAAVAALLV